MYLYSIEYIVVNFVACIDDYLSVTLDGVGKDFRIPLRFGNESQNVVGIVVAERMLVDVAVGVVSPELVTPLTIESVPIDGKS